MPQLIRPGQVKVITNEGEVELHVTIDLNINLSTGDLQVANVEKREQPAPKEDEVEEGLRFEIPKFESKEKVKFGIKGE